MLARLAILQLLIPAEALHMPMLAQQRAVAPTMSAIDRRAMLQNGPVVGALLFGLAPMVANAAEDTFSSMGGALQPYIDVQKGYKLYKPTAWNQAHYQPPLLQALSPLSHPSAPSTMPTLTLPLALRDASASAPGSALYALSSP